MKIDPDSPEPSMDEILASIRHIISSDPLDKKKRSSPSKSDKAKNDEDILDLTNLLPDEKVPAKKGSRPSEKGAPPNSFSCQSENLDFLIEKNLGPDVDQKRPSFFIEEESLVDSRVISETTQTLNSLNKLVQGQSPFQAPYTNNAKPGQSIEGLVRELLKPLLKEWLDANLPTLVQGVVSEQVEKIVNQIPKASPKPDQVKQTYPSKHA